MSDFLKEALIKVEAKKALTFDKTMSYFSTPENRLNCLLERVNAINHIYSS